MRAPQIKKAATNRYEHSMRPVIRLQLRHDAAHVTFDRVLGDAEFVCNDFVRISRRDGAEHLNFPGRERVGIDISR